MLLINYVSGMMWILCIDWQQYWKCDWIVDISANAHGKWTVSTKQPQNKRQTWQSGFQWHWRYLYWASFQVTRLFHSATVFWMLHEFVVLNFTRLITRMKIFWGVGMGMGGALSSNVFTLWCRILISRPPWVFRRFKRRSCSVNVVDTMGPLYQHGSTLNPPWRRLHPLLS